MKDIFKVAMLQMERSSDINNNIKKGIKFCKNAKLMGAGYCCISRNVEQRI